MKMQKSSSGSTVMLAALAVAPVFGQAPPPPPLPPPQLDQLVSRIALYPDPLIAQILAAATYPDQIRACRDVGGPASLLTGAGAGQRDSGRSIALGSERAGAAAVPLGSGNDGSDMNWTSQIGNAFLAQQPDVMDAVQRDAHKSPGFRLSS